MGKTEDNREGGEKAWCGSLGIWVIILTPPLGSGVTSDKYVLL